MNTNVLLIIIIVLLVLVLFIQILQLAAIAWLPNQFIDSFVGSSEDLLDLDQPTDTDVIEVNTNDQSQKKNSKGFGRSSKFKRWKLK